jgi:predicted esterase
MSRIVLALIVFPTVTFGFTACSSKAPPPGSGTIVEPPVVEPPKPPHTPISKPVPPLKLAAPAALAEQLNGENLAAMNADGLFRGAREAMANGDYPRAAAFQYWYVQKAKKGLYDLACFLGRTRQVDPAFYWLQKSALEEGVDSRHAERDADLESLRGDPRWGQVSTFLLDCNRYFESAPLAHTVLVLPKKYTKGTPIPAVMWLHGRNSRPEDLLGTAAQVYADQMNVALIGVSGTKPRGPRSFVWAEDPAADAKRLGDALAEVADRVTVQEGRVITLGFSQGAQVGLEVAVRHPEVYAGSIVLSPGAKIRLKEAAPSPLLAKRGFVVSCGTKELRGYVELTALDAQWLEKAGAQVIHKPYPGVTAHDFPTDFPQRFPEWVRFILKARDS